MFIDTSWPDIRVSNCWPVINSIEAMDAPVSVNLIFFIDRSSIVACISNKRFYYCCQISWVCPGWNWCEYPYRKYQVEPHSSTWFLTTCAAAIAHRYIFFRLHQHNKSSASKAKFKPTTHHCKRVLEVFELAYANKTKVCHFPEIWLSRLLTNQW